MAWAAGLLLASCADVAQKRAPEATTVLPVPPTTTPTPAPTDTTSVRLLAAGDIASCALDHDSRTAALVEAHPEAVVATLGDNVYERGTRAEFERCFAPTWGRFRDRIRPAVGNHEYGTSGARPYFEWFGAAAGRPGEGWYAYDLGAWRVLVLNSNCRVVSCRAGSTQERWLRAELAARAASRCTLAYWHHPRWSSGPHGGNPAVQPLWAALHAGGADVVLAGHDHSYERFAPLDAAGRPRPDGMRSFVVGTGGASLRLFRGAAPGSEVRAAGTWGVLALDLAPGGYRWEFLRSHGSAFTDAGEGRCR